MEEKPRRRKTVKPRVPVPEPEHELELEPEATEAEITKKALKEYKPLVVSLTEKQIEKFKAGKSLYLTGSQINPDYDPSKNKFRKPRQEYSILLNDTTHNAIERARRNNTGVTISNHEVKGAAIFKHIRRIGDFIKHNVKSKHIKSLAHYAINNSGMDDANKERIKQLTEGMIDRGYNAKNADDFAKRSKAFLVNSGIDYGKEALDNYRMNEEGGRLVKGSQAMKDKMARLRAMRTVKGGNALSSLKRLGHTLEHSADYVADEIDGKSAIGNFFKHLGRATKHTPFNARNLIKSVVVPAATIAASAAGYDGPIGQAMAQQGANALIDGSLNAANIGIGFKKRGRRPVGGSFYSYWKNV